MDDETDGADQDDAFWEFGPMPDRDAAEHTRREHVALEERRGRRHADHEFARATVRHGV